MTALAIPSWFMQIAAKNLLLLCITDINRLTSDNKVNFEAFIERSLINFYA